jgi:uncharacterized membrane protein
VIQMAFSFQSSNKQMIIGTRHYIIKLGALQKMQPGMIGGLIVIVIVIVVVVIVVVVIRGFQKQESSGSSS